MIIVSSLTNSLLPFTSSLKDISYKPQPEGTHQNRLPNDAQSHHP